MPATPTLVPLATTDASPLADQAGNVLANHNVFVYQPGTTTQVQVYDIGGNPLTQPLVTTGSGYIPGFVYAEQVIDVMDQATGITRSNVQVVSSADINMLMAFLSIGLAANYQVFTSGGTWVVPTGVTKLRIRAIGGGGGGGGGGSAAAAQLNAGGGGGAGGLVVDQEFTVTPGHTLTITINAGGTAGTGGAAAGNAGGNGGTGGAVTVVDTTSSTTLVSAPGGTSGAGSAASSTAAVGGGLYGNGLRATTVVTSWPGTGGASALNTAQPMVSVVGGGGGGAATATLGGGGGTAQASALLAQQTAGGSGGSGTSAGVVGATATQPGCGGAGGGGGAAGTGAGGAGGAGAAGQVELWW